MFIASLAYLQCSLCAGKSDLTFVKAVVSETSRSVSDYNVIAWKKHVACVYHSNGVGQERSPPKGRQSISSRARI